MAELTRLGRARAGIREAERLIALAERDGRAHDADANRRTLLVPALHAALEAASPAAPFDRAAAEEAFAEAYSAAAYGWSLSDFDAAKARAAREEAAAILALVRSGRLHKILFDAGIPLGERS